MESAVGISSWKVLFFINWTYFKPSDHLDVQQAFNSAIKKIFNVLIHPIYRALTLMGLTMNNFNSVPYWTNLFTLFANSCALSDWRTVGEPNIKNISILYPTSSTVLDSNGLSYTNFVKRSWLTMINLNSPSLIDCISIKSTCPLEFSPEGITGFMTSPFLHYACPVSYTHLKQQFPFLPKNATLVSRPT